MRKLKLFSALLLSSALVACGSSSSGGNASQSSNPASISSQASSSQSSAQVSSAPGSESSSSVETSSQAVSASSEVSSGQGSSSPVSSSQASSVQSSAASSSIPASSAPGSASSSSSEASSEQSSESSSSSAPAAGTCPAGASIYFCDDFSSGTSSHWQLLSHATNDAPAPNGVFDVVSDAGNQVLRFTAAQRGGELALINPASFAGVTGSDYFVEARIRPRQNSTTGNKFLYLLARYQSEGNWYGGGLNVQNTTDATRVEIARSIAGTINRPVQVSRPIAQGAVGALDGQWYTVRLELIGSTLSIYFNGEKVGETTDSNYTTPGLIGLYTANKSFEIDDIIVGDPALKPAQLSLSPAADTWTAEAESAAYLVTVTALQSDGSPDSFSVESSHPEVVSVNVAGNQVSLNPLAEGSAVVTFTSGSAPGLTRQIAATITPVFVEPDTTYDLSGRVLPAVGEVDVLRDTRLRLTFDSAPTLNPVGAVYLHRASDDSLIDTIKPVEETDVLSGNGGSRTLNTRQLWIEGNSLVVAPHTGVLAADTQYYVVIANGLITGTAIGGIDFEGLGKSGGWSFTTTNAEVSGNEVTVASSGPADFRSVQGALSYAMSRPQNDPVTIDIRNGTYQELLFLRNKHQVTLRGESRDGVVIQYTNNEQLNSGTSNRALFLVEGADLLTLEDLTLINTTLIGQGGQAETLYFNSQNRLIVRNSRFYSEQDTLQLKGWAWFYQSLIEGNVDFIWGGNRVSLFEDCEIRTIGRSSGSGGYVLQARSVEAGDKGFVFLNSQLTRGQGPTGVTPGNNTIPLARSGGGSGYFDNIVFVNTRMDSHITAAGWHTNPTPNPAVATASSGWREYNTRDLSGNPVDTDAWVSYRLLEAEYLAEFSTREQVFSAYNNGAGWNPAP